jgi:Xaa-Pro aminopeptidase
MHEQLAAFGVAAVWNEAGCPAVDAGPDWLLGVSHVYTVEPGLMVPGYRYVGLEEDVRRTESGAEYVGEPQR